MNRPVTETHFVVKCHCCGQAYFVPRSRTLGQEKFLAMSPRCINTQGTLPNDGRGASFGVVKPGRLCGAPLGRGMFSRGSLSGRFVEAEALLDYIVTKPNRNETRTVAAAELAKRDFEQRITELQAEVDRLKEKYETPCKGHAKHWHDSGEGFHLVPCGGFMGHPGDCAEVW